MKLIFKIRSAYGRDIYYPDNQLADHMLLLLNQKTATPVQIRSLKNMGFEVEIIPYTGEEGKS